ncbi:MAG: rRNA maturation RNase YbeY [Pseudomonadota bacterium]
MSLQIDIANNAGQWPDKTAIEAVASKAVRRCLKELKIEDVESELSIVLTNDDEIRKLNENWRKKDNATNVLSFPAFEMSVGQMPGPMLGDIVLAVETIEREARELGISFLDHLTHLIVHGLLHLLGYDHENDTDAEQMEALETEILAQLGIKDPYSVPISDS